MMERPTTPRRASVIDAEGIAACHANCFSGAWDVEFISRLLADPARLAWVVEDTAGLTAFLIAAQAAFSGASSPSMPICEAIAESASRASAISEKILA